MDRVGGTSPTPNSLKVGTSGMAFIRISVDTPNPRVLPARTMAIASVGWHILKSICPPNRATLLGPAPAKGTYLVEMPAAFVICIMIA